MVVVVDVLQGFTPGQASAPGVPVLPRGPSEERRQESSTGNVCGLHSLLHPSGEQGTGGFGCSVHNQNLTP